MMFKINKHILPELTSKKRYTNFSPFIEVRYSICLVILNLNQRRKVFQREACSFIMQYWKGVQVNKQIVIFLIYIVFITSYVMAASKYQRADTYLKNGDYEMAAEEYQKILEASGSASLSKDTQAMTGAFISFYHLKKYKRSFAYCKRVLKLDTYNSCAIFYAGQNLEALGKGKEARALYKYYTRLSSTDPYRPFLKARHDDINRLMIKNKIKNSIQLEQKIRTPQIPDNTVAVLYFVNESDDKSWDEFSKGFTQLLSNDLAQLKSIKLIDRLALQELLDQLQLSQSQLIDENLIPRFGKLLQARYIINGSFTINDSEISLNVGLLDTKRPDVIEYTEFYGKLYEFYKLEKTILIKALDNMNLMITQSERKAITSFQTKNLTAFLSYCQGLDAYDSGNYDVAYNHFAQAFKQDTKFFLAKEVQQAIDAMVLIEQGNLAMSHFRIIGRGIISTTAQEVGGLASATRARLENIASNLALGYLPGNDSRNGTSNIDFSNIQLGRKLLPTPPNPPGN